MKKHPILVTASPWILFSVTVLLVLFLMSTPTLNLLSDNQSSALALLQGYRRQYILILIVLSLGPVLTGIFTVVSICFGETFKDSVKLMLRAFVCSLVLLFGIGFGAHIPRTIGELSADIAQIAQNTTEQTVVWLSPNFYLAQMTDLVRTKTVTRYGGIGADTGHTWQDFYLPHALAFSPTPDMLFDDKRSISWNEEHTPKYEIAYTSHFRLIVSIERAA